MDENGKIDEILARACSENREILLPFGPDFAGIEKNALLKLRQRRGSRTRKLWFRTAAAVAAAFIAINGFLLFAEIEPVKAYRAEIRSLVFNLFSNNQTGAMEAELVRTSTEIDRAQKTVPYHIPTPGWIPEGYEFSSACALDDGNDATQVKIRYKKQDESLEIDITNDTSISSTMPSTGEGNLEELDINGMKVYAASVKTEKGSRIFCYYYNGQGLGIYISGDMDKQSLTKFIEEFK